MSRRKRRIWFESVFFFPDNFFPQERGTRRARLVRVLFVSETKNIRPVTGVISVADRRTRASVKKNIDSPGGNEPTGFRAAFPTAKVRVAFPDTFRTKTRVFNSRSRPTCESSTCTETRNTLRDIYRARLETTSGTRENVRHRITNSGPGREIRRRGQCENRKGRFRPRGIDRAITDLPTPAESVVQGSAATFLIAWVIIFFSIFHQHLLEKHNFTYDTTSNNFITIEISRFTWKYEYRKKSMTSYVLYLSLPTTPFLTNLT